MPKKEKVPRAEKPPKVKKEKPPKVKKEKPPKQPQAAEGEAAEKGGGKKKLLLILLPVVLIVAAAAVFLATRVLGRMPEPEDAEDPEATESGSEDGEEGPEEADGEDTGGEDGEEAGPEVTQAPVRIRTSMTTAEIVEFIQRLPPDTLGLAGEDMSDYELFASESVALIDGQLSTQVRVYSKGDASGTNDIEGIYYLTRAGSRKLYRYDEATNTVEELPLTLPAPAAEDAPEPAEEEAEGTGED